MNCTLSIYFFHCARVGIQQNINLMIVKRCFDASFHYVKRFGHLVREDWTEFRRQTFQIPQVRLVRHFGKHFLSYR